MAIINTSVNLPENCEECERKGIRGNCRFIFSGLANCGRHPSCPLKDVDDIRSDIEKLKVFDDGGLKLISQNAVERIIDKYSGKAEL